MDQGEAWRALLRLAGRAPAGDHARPDHAGLERARELGAPEARKLLALYQPLAAARPGGRFVVAHLGQSLDGRIALGHGDSRWITGPEDVLHNHRMRALFDAVLVGGATIASDDPKLTVREVEGRNPTRVVLDLDRRLGPGHVVFADSEAPTVVLRRAGNDVPAPPGVDVIDLDRREAASPPAMLERLAASGLRRIFIEGGGVTVSRFLAAGCLDRLQITIAPVILGSGRRGLVLPAIGSVAEALRPPCRRFMLGDDVLFEARFGA